MPVDSMPIILYDIPSTLPGKAWSPNVWKARFCLNFKGIPHTTEWPEYPDIEPHCKKSRIPPTDTKPDGSPFYTLPVIHDPSTGAYISDSFKITEYLEKTYPDTSLIFPFNTEGVQAIFDDVFSANALPLLSIAFPDIMPSLSLESAAHNKAKVEAVGSKNRVEGWVKAEEGMAKVASYYNINIWKGPFLLGDVPSWPDIAISSFLEFYKATWGEDGKEWKKIASWDGGRWESHSALLKNSKLFIEY